MLRYDIVVKKVEPMKVVSVRGVVPQPTDQDMLWRELGAYLAHLHIRPKCASFALYHDEERKERDWDIEVCQPVTEDPTPTSRIKVYSLPGIETMACVLHAGPLATIDQAYEAIQTWLRENQYQIVGPCREVALRSAYPDGNQNDPNTMTEIQYPVEKMI